MMHSNKDNIMLLKPSTVSEVVEDLLESNIISKVNIANLKKDKTNMRDPNLMMYVRHREVKKESLINDIECHTNRSIKKSRDTHYENFVAPKDLQAIDSEIAKTKRNLEMFKKQLIKKTKSFMKSVQDLEVIEEHTANPQNGISCSEEVSKDCFDKHLDVLEDQENEISFENKVWKPFTVKTSPVIDVVTRSKNYQDVATGENNQFNSEELEILTKCSMSSTFVGETPTNELTNELDRPVQQIITNTVPNNSPALLQFTGEWQRDKNTFLAKHVLKTWKSFVNKKTFERYKKAKQVFDTMTMKNILTSWSMHVKCIKELKPNRIEHINKKSALVPLKYKNKIYLTSDTTKEETRIPLELHKTTLEPCLVSNLYTGKTSYHEVSLIEGNSKTNVHNAKYRKEEELNRSEASKTNTDHPKLVVQELVVNNIMSDEKQMNKEDTTHTKSLKIDEKTKLKAVEGVSKNQSSFEYRYVAQEKIITQQLAVIEKQKQIIFDLQAEHLQKQSDLGLKLVETQLAQVSASYRKNLKPVIKTNIVADSKAKLKETKKQNIHELAERLTKSLQERQEYCKQLAEKTKMRKLLIEEQKIKQQIELEEMEKQKREEERRQRILQVKMNKKIAKEKLKKEHATKLQRDEKIQRVTVHHKNKLLGEYFQKLRKAAILVKEKYKECDTIYNKKLLKHIFFKWKNEANHCINERTQAAGKYHDTKLLERHWHIWIGHHREFKIKMQVSDDMFELKIQERMLKRWLAYTAKSYLRNCFKLELADRLRRRQMLRRCLNHWRELPKQMLSERERETRCRAWRQAVQELVPDFSPLFAEQFEV